MMTPDGNEVDIVEVVEPGSVSKSLSLDDALPRVSALSREKGNRPGAGADDEPAAPLSVADAAAEAFMAWCRSAPCMDGASMGCTEISRGSPRARSPPAC